MKYWPIKKWKKILLLVLIALLIVSVSVLIFVSFVTNNDTITELVIKNPEGSKTAIILYNPGITSFAHDVSYAFAEGLLSNDWRVEIATPSEEAPTDLSKYSLLVIASNTYGFNPDNPTIRHLDRLGDLKGIDTVLLTLGAGSVDQSQKALEGLIETSNGTIIESLRLHTMAPNDGDLSATELAELTAKGLT